MQGRRDGDVLALGRTAVGSEGEVVVIDLVVGEVDRCFGDVFFGDGFNEKTRASNVVLIIHVEPMLVLGEDDVLGSGHGSMIRTSG